MYEDALISQQTLRLINFCHLLLKAVKSPLHSPLSLKFSHRHKYLIKACACAQFIMSTKTGATRELMECAVSASWGIK